MTAYLIRVELHYFCLCSGGGGECGCSTDIHRAHNDKNVYLNVLNPTGHVMHQQFNIQKLYALPTLYLCVLYLSENKQRLVPLTA